MKLKTIATLNHYQTLKPSIILKLMVLKQKIYISIFKIFHHNLLRL